MKKLIKLGTIASSGLFMGLTFISCAPTQTQTPTTAQSTQTAPPAQATATAQTAATAQSEDPAYVKVTQERADKIVQPMNLTDAAKAARVRDAIAQQYRDLSRIHDARDAQIKELKAKAGEDKKAAEPGIKKLEEQADAELAQLHTRYLAKLSADLTPKQVDQVKDGMTYGVVPITYQGYLDMLPTLTEEQKSYILTNLVEARELAMDAGSSHKKHATFGKYKGRINNYLSAAGYDLKKAGEEWQARLKAEEAAKAKAK